MSKCFEIQLSVNFYYKCIHVNFFIIMKILTEFRKTVETGMDPRLHSSNCKPHSPLL